MPNRQIVNPQSENVEVQIYGQDMTQSVNIDTVGRVAVTGLVSVTTLGPLSVTGAVIGNLTILNTPTVIVSGTPNVTLTGTPIVSGTVSIIGSPTIQIGAHGFTQINQTFSSGLISVGVPYNLPAVNISNLNTFSYYVMLPSSLISLVTINLQLSPNGTEFATAENFTNLGAGGLNLGVGGNLTTNKYLFYSRLQFNITSLLSGATVTVIFLGQY